MEDTIQHKWWNLVWICVFQKYVNCIFFDASAKQIMLLFFLFSNFRVCFFLLRLLIYSGTVLLLQWTKGSLVMVARW